MIDEYKNQTLLDKIRQSFSSAGHSVSQAMSNTTITKCLSDDVSLSQILLTEICDKLALSGILVSKHDYNHGDNHVSVMIQSEEFRYRLSVDDLGHAWFTLSSAVGNNYQVDVNRESYDVANPVYDPSRIIDTIVKVCVFLNSMSRYISNFDIEWAVRGMEYVIDNSNGIIVSRNVPSSRSSNFFDHYSVFDDSVDQFTKLPQHHLVHSHLV